MNYKTKKLLNSVFVSSEELWRSQRVLSSLANNSSDDTQSHSIIAKYPLDDSLSSPMNWHCCNRFLPGFRIISQKLHQFCSFLVRAAIIYCNHQTKTFLIVRPLWNFQLHICIVHYFDSQPLILGG